MCLKGKERDISAKILNLNFTPRKIKIQVDTRTDGQADGKVDGVSGRTLWSSGCLQCSLLVP